jgi:hypothetical protein
MKPSNKQISSLLRDGVALIIWGYVLVKIFVFDIDFYLLNLVSPNLAWILNIRLFVLLSVIAVLWLIVGHKRFFALFAYIVGYPLVILFWKLPVFIFRRWAAFLILLPSIFDTLLSFRRTFVLYTVILVSSASIFLSKQPAILISAMVALALCLVFMLYRAFSRTNSTRIYSRLAEYLRGVQTRITDGEFDVAPFLPSQPAAAQMTSEEASAAASLPQLYIHYVIFDYISQKVDQVDRAHKYNLILISSLLNIMFWTVIIFSFLHWAVYKIDPSAYSGIEGRTFLQFLVFSLGRFANTDIVSIHPASAASITLTSIQVICSLFIMIIGVFSIFTAQRDSFREDFKEFLDVIHKIVELINERIVIKHSVNSTQLEMDVAVKSAGVVNLLRRLRGLSELELSEDQGETPPSTGM